MDHRPAQRPHSRDGGSHAAAQCDGAGKQWPRAEKDVRLLAQPSPTQPRVRADTDAVVPHRQFMLVRVGEPLGRDWFDRLCEVRPDVLDPLGLHQDSGSRGVGEYFGSGGPAEQGTLPKWSVRGRHQREQQHSGGE
jgi:hypothetical protein